MGTDYRLITGTVQSGQHVEVAACVMMRARGDGARRRTNVARSMSLSLSYTCRRVPWNDVCVGMGQAQGASEASRHMPIEPLSCGVLGARAPSARARSSAYCPSGSALHTECESP